ncbi:CRISPR-associated protein, Csy4 family [Escherichia coli]|uniref:CRISPR-associated protein, Csy4 family n=1 Tax=Escherichia coli TaxID=562 RepID=A0A376W4C2_ECOLX|nr:CRISPR-associated protein, Csy4 family [Escherichia coli]
MDHYLEIRVLPDPEFSSEMLMAALFAKLQSGIRCKRARRYRREFPGRKCYAWNAFTLAW